MVVVLPAPFGPSRPKHSPRLHLEVEAIDRHDVVVALHQRRGNAARTGQPSGTSVTASANQADDGVVGRMIVSSRSDPVDTMPTGTPTTSSRCAM